MKQDNEVYMVMVDADYSESGELRQLNATPVVYNLDGGDGNNAKALGGENAPDSLDNFIDLARADIDGLCGMLIHRGVESEMDPNEAYVMLLNDFQSQPVELTHNMLAAMLVAQIEMERADIEDMERVERAEAGDH